MKRRLYFLTELENMENEHVRNWVIEETESLKEYVREYREEHMT